MHFHMMIPFLLSLVFVTPVWAQEGQIDTELALEQARSAASLIGAGAGVMVEGEIIALAAGGERRSGYTDRPSTDSIWHMGSITKSMTATMIATLIEDEILDFDTTVGEVFTEDTHPDWAPITLSDLLSHRSGAPANFSLSSMFSGSPETIEEISTQRQEQVRALLRRTPRTEQGGFVYSNAGYTIAGAMAERVTDQSWEELMVERVFTPLGVTFRFGPDTGETALWGHRNTPFGKQAVNPEGSNADNPAFIGPAGTVAMTMEALLNYGWMHLGGGEQIVSADMLNRLHTPLPSDHPMGSQYAYGWVYDQDGAGLGLGPVIWHNGSNTMWYALLILIPDHNAVMVFTSNDGDVPAAERTFFNLARDLAPLIAQTP